MKDIQQLIKKDNQEGRYNNIFPKSYTEAIQSRETGEFLDVTLQKTNFLFLSYNGSEEDTRLQVPSSMRRKGLWISYVTFEGSIISNFYNGEGIGDAQWKDGNNWISSGIGGIQEIVNDIKDWVNSYISYLISTAITNATKLNPEDLSKNSEGEIQLTDRDSTNGMGYVILRKNKTFAEQVTKENTIYEIRYDYDLNGQEITIPENCVLQFEGGSLSNGVVLGYKTNISENNSKWIGNELTLNGTWSFGSIKPEWFVNSDDTQAIQLAINLAISLDKDVKLGREYSITSTINIDRLVDGEHNSFFNVSGGTLIIAAGVSAFGSSFEYNNTPNSQWISFNNVIFEGGDTSFVIDRNKLLRTKFEGCTFHVRLLESDDYVQTLYFTSCEIRSFNGTWMKCNEGCYDIKITNCMFDSFNGIALELYGGEVHQNSNVSIINSLLEGLNAGIKYKKINGLSVIGCYFEANKQGDIICVDKDTDNRGIAIIGNLMFGNYEDNTDGESGYYHIIWGRCYGAFSAANSYANSGLHYTKSPIIDIKIQDPLIYTSKKLCNNTKKIGNIWFGDKLPTVDGAIVNYSPEVKVGDIIINTDNSTNRNVGWVCTESGRYDTAKWTPWGSIPKVERYNLNDDLNNFKSEGIYYPPTPQMSTVTGSNFPINISGILEVSTSAIDGVIQRYYPFRPLGDNGICFYRTFYGYGGRWSNWYIEGYGTVENDSTNGIIEGQINYNTTLKKMILWNGTAWVNLDGTALAGTNAIEEIPASQDTTY